MLSIRLRRIGKKKQASFRVVAAEARSKSKAKFVEDLGWVNPHTDKFELKKDRVSYWLEHGAQPSETMSSYIRKTGIETKGRTK
ncbi:MAG: 30S ribosomal protein S16 [Candidatus Colwellbacteria bacterium]|nr:30S ribosomal protein S16 [Candidatus Colwellbacteria bacterium]